MSSHDSRITLVDVGLPPRVAAVARCLQGDIPLESRPFRSIAEAVSLSEEEVLTIAGRMKDQGIVRKFGAIVRHQLAGYRHNVMVLWAVSPDQCDTVGKRLASFAEVTHCYERNPPFAGRYNLFTMVHFRRQGDETLLSRMAEAAGVTDYKVLRSLEEYKKSSMEYF